MGATIAALTVRNLIDIHRVEQGELAPDKVREIQVYALVDTGASHVGLNREHIEQLGLRAFKESEVMTGGGVIVQRLFDGAQMELKDRLTSGVVMEIPEGLPPIIGFILLEELDLVVDPVNQRVIGNPEHDGVERAWLLANIA